MDYIVAVTGASGMLYAQNIIRHLRAAGHNIFLTFTQNSEAVLRQELNLTREQFIEILNGNLKAGAKGEIVRVDINDLLHPVCSGSFRHSGMLVVPSSINTMSRLASGLAGNIVERAAQVCLKEKYPLIIVLRETPLSSVIIENMLRLSHAGAVLLPACPGFYSRPETIDALADFISAKIMNILGLKHKIKLYEV